MATEKYYLQAYEAGRIGDSATLTIGITNFRHSHHLRLKDTAHHGDLILYALRNQDFRAMGLEGAATQVRCLGLINLFVYYIVFVICPSNVHIDIV